MAENPTAAAEGSDPALLNPPWAFGRGKHFCIGSNLARAEARIAIGTLPIRLEA